MVATISKTALGAGAAGVDWWERIAQALADAVPGRNDVIEATVAADLGLTNATPIVQVDARGARVTALWACPKAIRVGGGCFVARTAPDAAADWVVLATNYQAGGVVNGYGNGGYGSIPYGE